MVQVQKRKSGMFQRDNVIKIEHHNYSNGHLLLCESKSLTEKKGGLACNRITYSCATAHDFHMIPLYITRR